MRYLVPGLIMLAMGACQPSAPGALEAADGASLLISGADLEARLHHPDVVVLHVARERTGYDAGHVPGARFVRTGDILTERNGVPNMLPDVAVLRPLFEESGVSNDSHVILYGDWGGLSATRAFVTLEYLGLDRVSLLDGGLEAWQAEGRPISREAPRFARGSFEPRPRPDIVVDAEWVRAHRTDAAYVLIDARPRPHYLGSEGGDRSRFPRWGHITGAENVFWQETLESGDRPVFLPRPEIERMYREASATPGRTVVAYCGTGVQASHAYFTSRLLGRRAKIYDGSFIDWSPRDESFPVTGPDGR